MKYKIILYAGVILFVALISSCKKSSNPTAPVTLNKNFYPNGDGSYYKYNVTSTDSAGNNVSGTRSSTYNGTAVLSGQTFQQQVDTLTFSGISSTSLSYFSKDNSGVYFYLDTAGLAQIIPDTLLPYIQLSPKLTLFEFPFQDGKNWSVFKMNLNYGVLNLTLVDVQAYFQGLEAVTIGNNQTIQDAAKVHFVFKLTFPDPSNPFQTVSQTYTANAWLGENIGIIKWQGSGVILNAFGGSGISFADTSSTITQTLVSYKVK